MIGVYFSGTGNTKHCVEEFVKHCGNDNAAIAMESADVIEMIKRHDFIVLGYPIQYSNTPKFVRDFVVDNRDCFKNKKVFIIATMGLFSGDGAGCAARLLKKYGAVIIGGLHLKMPDCIGDVKALKKSPEANREIIRQANDKIAVSAKNLQDGKPDKDGLSVFSHVTGLFGQRLWFYGKTASYKKKPDIDTQKCIGCGRCAGLCPMKNIEIIGNKAVSGDKCTMCYRCVSHCPTKSLTILGNEVYEQCRFENYH